MQELPTLKTSSVYKEGSVLYTGILNLINYDSQGCWIGRTALKFTTSVGLRTISFFHVAIWNPINPNDSDGSRPRGPACQIAHSFPNYKYQDWKEIAQQLPATFERRESQSGNFVFHNHSLPVELLAGTWDARFKEFLSSFVPERCLAFWKNTSSRAKMTSQGVLSGTAKQSAGERIPIVAR